METNNTWAKYCFSCKVDSVYYQKLENERACAVLFTVSFNVDTLKSAHIPTRVKDTRMLRYCPSREQIVILSEHSISKTLTIAPSVAVAGASVTAGSYRLERKGKDLETLKLTVHDELGTDVHWKLTNDNCRYSPSSIQFLIVVTTSPGSPTIFPFQLQILSEVKVIPKGPEWHTLSFLFGTKKVIPPINIKEAFDSQRAEKCFKELMDGQPVAVGLTHAVGPYQTACKLMLVSPTTAEN